MRQSIRGQRFVADRVRVIDQVAVRPVFDLVTCRIKPIVENLAALDVPPDTPGVATVLLGEELVAAGFEAEFIDTIYRKIQNSHFKRRLPVIAKVSNRTIDRDFRYSRDWGK